jgi:hypothetical protein
MRHLLHQEGYSVHRPKRTMKRKRDEVAYAAATKQLHRLEKALKKGASDLLVFRDEVEIHRHPALSRM